MGANLHVQEGEGKLRAGALPAGQLTGAIPPSPCRGVQTPRALRRALRRRRRAALPVRRPHCARAGRERPPAGA
eukprot:scaffold306_cov525-Prasinococcus_capsulatus_cf.AAC.36